ncbi:MAG: hypothetical protein GY856_48795 [bacterium]|nr:hypothetical protein [bacterium]
MGIRIRFHYDKRSGKVREMTVDDGDRLAPEAEHDAIAQAIADQLLLGATIREDRVLTTAELLPDGQPASQPGRERTQSAGKGDKGS